MWAIGLAIVLLMIRGAVGTLCPGWHDVLGGAGAPCESRVTTAHWIDFVIFGLAQGSLYALIALGYTLVYGILRMINFAHGEVFMSGAFTSYFVAQPLYDAGVLANEPALGLLIILAGGALTSTVIAVLLERIAYRPLRRAPRLVPLITAIGASLFLQQAFSGLYGSGVKTYPAIPVLEGKWEVQTAIGPVAILKTQVVVIVAAVVFMVLLYAFVQFTKTGRAMRAVAEDKDTAALMGIDVDAIIVRTFVIGGSLAGAAGVLYAVLNKQVQFYMGFFPGLKAFTAAVLGGIGNIPGAMLGGLFLGVFESIGPNLFLDGLGIPAPYQLKDAIAFTLLVLILIFRPTGILGELLAEKKA